LENPTGQYLIKPDLEAAFIEQKFRKYTEDCEENNHEDD
jgi:hypothetical protein